MKYFLRLIIIATLLVLAACSNSVPTPEGLEPQIVGGANATRGQFPWATVLKLDGNYRCGASIIRTQWVITAAHCVSSFGVIFPVDKLSIVAGEHNRTVVESSEQTRTVTKIFIQPGISDIAILKLSTPLVFNSRVRPIGFLAPVLGTATMAGWGQVGDGGLGEEPLANILKFYEPNIWLISPEYLHVNGKLLDPNKGTHEQACYGDSGSGLVQPNALGTRRLIGVLSSIYSECKLGAAQFGRPKVSWINQTILAN